MYFEKIIREILKFKIYVGKFLSKAKLAKYFGLIHNFKNTKEWLIENNKLNNNYFLIFPAEEISFNKPKSLVEERNVMFSKIGEEFNLKMKLKEVFVANISNGRYIAKSGSCVTEDGILLEDVSVEFGSPQNRYGFEHSVFFSNIPKETYYDKTIAVIDSAGSYDYYHWIINVLPKIDFYERSKLNIDYYIVSIDKSFQRQSLEFINFPFDKIIPNNDFLNVKAKNLIVSPIVSTGVLSPQSLKFLKNKFNLPKKLEKRIFITRRNASQGRKIINEDKVINLIKNYGFEVFELEKMSFYDQMQLFSSASVVLAPHGAGLTNMIFCPSEVKIIEIFNPNYMQNVYAILASLMKFDYYYIVGDGYNPNGNHYDCSGNINMNIYKLEKILKLTGL